MICFNPACSILGKHGYCALIPSPDCSGYPAARLKGKRGVIAESGKQLQITKNYCVDLII